MSKREFLRDFPDTPDDVPFASAQEGTDYMRQLVAPFAETSQIVADQIPTDVPGSEQ